MNAFRMMPRNPYANLFGAIFGGSLIGTVLIATWSVLVHDVAIYRAFGPVLLFWGVSFVFGAVVAVVYAAPAIVLLSRLNLAGPVNAMLVSMLPAAVLALIEDIPNWATLFGVYGFCGGAIFCWLAYIRNKVA